MRIAIKTCLLNRFVTHLNIALLLGSSLSCSLTESSDSPSSEGPNIVLILADDLGYGDLGVYGQEKIETPNIDQLAKNGMIFTQHYSGSPVCAPSRCVLLTGKHTGYAHIRSNDEWRERGEVWDFAKAVEDPYLEGQRPIPAGTPTLGRLLQQAGYKTAIVGKWGLGAPLTEGIPNKQGFDFFFGYNCQRQAHTYFPQHLWKNEEKVWLDNELVVPNTKLPEGTNPYDSTSYLPFTSQPDYAPELMLEESLQFIENHQNQPFFLYFASPIPHVPLQAPQRWVDYYHEKFGDEDPYLGERNYFPVRYPQATYAAMVSYLDEQVGKLVDKLKETGTYDHTLIVFTSDNGPSFNGGTDSEFFDSAKPFRGDYGRGKGTVYEGGIRVPFIASWSGKIESGTTSDYISAFWDILPTFCEIAGTKAPKDVNGLSMVSVLEGKKLAKTHEFLYWEFPSYQGQQAVRMGKWKAIRKNIFKGNMDFELYDLETDPTETTDIASSHPDVIARMEEIVQNSRTMPENERFRFVELGDE